MGWGATGGNTAAVVSTGGNIYVGTGDRTNANSLKTRILVNSGEVSFNDDSTDTDFRVESNNNTHMLFVDAGNGRIGVGESSPGNTLQLNGGNIVNPNSTGSEITSATFGVGGNIHLEERQPNGAYSDRTDLVIVTNTGFGVGESEKFRLTAGGNAGIGVVDPLAPLSINKTPDTNYGVANFAVPSGNPTWVTLNRDGSQDGGFKIQRSTTADMRLFVNSDEATVLNYNGGNTGDSFQIIQGAGSGALRCDV